MRFTFEHNLTPRDLAKKVTELLLALGEMGVDQVDGVNLYCNVRASGEILELRSHDGANIDVIRVHASTVQGYIRSDAAAPGSAGLHNKNARYAR